MKKAKLLAIIAIALTSVFAFTSCDKNNDDINNNDPNKENGTKEKGSYFYVPVGVEQLKYIDATYTLNVDGQTVNVKSSEMTEVKDIKSIDGIDSWLKTVQASEGDVSFKVYSYSLGNIKKAQYVSSRYTMIARPDHDIAVLIGHMFTINGYSDYYSSCHVFGSVSDVQSMVDVLNGEK